MNFIFGFGYFRPNSNEAISVQTLNTAGSQWGHPKTDYSCFKKITTSDGNGESGNNLLLSFCFYGGPLFKNQLIIMSI